MQNATFHSIDEGEKTHMRLKLPNGAYQNFELTDTLKITINPTGELHELREGDVVEFSGQPPVELIITRQSVPNPDRVAAENAARTEPTPQSPSSPVHHELPAQTHNDPDDDEDDDEDDAPTIKRAVPKKR